MKPKMSKEDQRFEGEIARIAGRLLSVLVEEHKAQPDEKLMMMAVAKLAASLSIEYAIRNSLDPVGVLDWLYAYVRSVHQDLRAARGIGKFVDQRMKQ